MTAAHEAIVYVGGRASRARDESVRRLEAVTGSPACTFDDTIRRTARLTLNFHPDRVDRFGRTVAAGLLADGRYRPQNETWLSGGSRSALPGGERFGFEANLFGTTYDNSSQTRPTYGALDVTHDPFGAAPFAGSSVVVLNSACFDRSTFCVGDSHLGPTDIGTSRQFEPILAGMFEQAARGSGYGLSVPDLLDAIDNGVRAAGPSRRLDGYVEAQVHGGISLSNDVVAVVLDPSFRGSEIERDLSEAADRYGFELLWHCGSRLGVDDVPSDLRGPQMPAFAAEVVQGLAVSDAGAQVDSGQKIDASMIGRSLANALGANSASPPRVGGDPPSSSHQLHKKLWHCVYHLGRAAEGAENSP